jgi:hypothetical protein
MNLYARIERMALLEPLFIGADDVSMVVGICLPSAQI